LRAGDTKMILTPDSDFFRYLNDPKGRARAPNGEKKQ